MKNRGPGGSNRSSLFSKISWLMFYRAMVVTLLLGATAAMQGQEGPLVQDAPPSYLYGLIGFTYALTLAYAFLLRRVRKLKAFAYGQIAGDVLFITLLVYFTGGSESIFSWVYLLSIIGASIILYRRGGLFTASLASILYGLLLDLEFYQVIPALGRVSLSAAYQSGYVFYLISMNMLAFYLVALLSASLSEQVRRKEEELKERLIDYDQLERLYKHIVQNMTSGLITIDGHDRVTSFNRTAEEITGCSFEDAYQEEIGRIFPEMMAPAPSRGGAPEKGSHRFPRWETAFQKKNGARLILGFSMSPLKDSSGRELGRILVFQDLTKLREMEEELKRADRLAAVGRLAAGMAHEIRNPLASISGSIEILKEELKALPQPQELMDIILREVNRLNSLIADFLLFARPTSPGRDLIHLPEVIRETLKVFSQSPDCRPQIRTSAHLEEDFCLQGGDPQIRQVLWNLFINAAQAMPEGGELRVELRRHAPLLPDEPARGEILVSDTGLGIGEEAMDHIFDPFFTTKEKGTGLGLSIVHRIVESYGGKITVRSRLGQGTAFSLFFPLR